LNRRVKEFKLRRKHSRILSVAVLALMLSACTGRQVYQSAAGWRMNECQKILEDAERARCMQSANKDYDTYKKEKGGADER
jgi:hypothetical protein